MWKSRKDYSEQNNLGQWFNTEFPPEVKDPYHKYHGYKTWSREALFYTFAVLYYDAHIKIGDEEMLLIADDDDGCCVTDTDYNDISPDYPTANDLIKEFRLPDGRSLLDAVDSNDFYIQPF